MAQKVWIKSKNDNGAGSMPTYYLNKEVYPDVFCTVKAVNGLYTFTFGKRAKSEDENPKRFSWIKKGFKSAANAKKHAIESIKITDLD